MLDLDHELSIYIAMSKLVCMWPPWKYGRGFLGFYWSCVAVVILIITYHFLSFALKILLQSQQDIDDMAELVHFSAVVGALLFRYCYMTYRGPALPKIISKMQQIFVGEAFFQDGIRYTIKPMQVLGKRMAMLYYFSASLFCYQLVLSPLVTILLDSTLELPLIYNVWQPLDVSQRYQRVVIYIQQSIGTLVCGHIHLLMDAFWIYVLVVTIEQVKVIKMTYKSLNLSPNASESPELTKNVLVQCIKHHVQIRRFVADVENLISPMILVDFITMMGAITFITLDLTNAMLSGDYGKCLNLSQFLLSCVVHMFCFDYLSNELTLQEMLLADAVYEIPWYIAPKKFKTELLMTMSITNHPSKITGCKLFTLSLEFFMQKMNTTFSFIMVLLRLSSNELVVD